MLVTDNDSSWKTPDVEHLLASHSVDRLFYPKYLGTKLDPCDNSFHAQFRHAYDARILLEGDVDLPAPRAA